MWRKGPDSAGYLRHRRGIIIPTPPHLPSSRRLAALDVGSLTVRLAVAELTGGGDLRQVLQLREVTGLGDGLARNGNLTAAAMDRTAAALRQFRQAMAAHRVKSYRAVGTQALRQAANRQVFLDRAHGDMGLTVQVLTPAAEARLTLAGVLSALAPEYRANQEVVVFDVGGGSTEWAIITPPQPPVFASLPLGVLTLSQARPLGDPPPPANVAALQAELAEQLSQFYLNSLRPHLQGRPHLVGTAGAVTTLAAMSLKLQVYDKDKVTNLILARGRIQELAAEICRVPEAVRARLPGMEKSKAGVMVAGALIILTILQVMGADALVVVDAGLLEGVLQEVAQDISVSRFP